MDRPHALIAGAGVGGLAAALCLAKSGWQASVFEAAPALEEVGAGLQLSPNATAILRRLGVLDRLIPASLAPQSIRVRRAADGATLALMPLGAAETRWGAPYLLAHRADLLRALVDAVAQESAIKLQTGVAVAGFGSSAKNVTAALRQGPLQVEATGDCLIGADGYRSTIRQRLSGGAPDLLEYSGRTAWRTLVEADRAPREALVPQSCLWLGRKAHLVHYPLRGGSVVNVVAIVEEKTEPAGQGWSEAGEAAVLAGRFAGWHKSARALIEAADEWRKWPLYQRAPLSGLASGQVALLGDAAHPMLPFLAQGAAQAIEDAAALGQALQGAADVPRGLAAYSAARIGRASRVQAQSRVQGKIYHLGGPAALARDMAMRALGGDRMLARYDWLYATRKSSRVDSR